MRAGSSYESQTKPTHLASWYLLFEDDSSKLVSLQTWYSRGQYTISAKITVNRASNEAFGLAMEKETGSVATQTANEQTEGKENLGEVSNYQQWKT